MNHKLQAKELESCTPMYRGTMQKAYAGTVSPRAAIKAMCLYCVGYQRVEITDCTSFACPLHFYRPFQAGTNDAESDETTAEASE